MKVKKREVLENPASLYRISSIFPTSPQCSSGTSAWFTGGDGVACQGVVLPIWQMSVSSRGEQKHNH
eukprot:scaffold1205_cov249-Pinguiococcus_pyrenoidosus.AAC.8